MVKPKDSKYRSRSQKLCRPHATGVPVNMQGRRFYKPGCSRCEENREAGRVTTGDPTPEQIHAAWYRKNYSAYNRAIRK